MNHVIAVKRAHNYLRSYWRNWIELLTVLLPLTWIHMHLSFRYILSSDDLQFNMYSSNCPILICSLFFFGILTIVSPMIIFLFIEIWENPCPFTVGILCHFFFFNINSFLHSWLNSLVFPIHRYIGFQKECWTRFQARSLTAIVLTQIFRLSSLFKIQSKYTSAVFPSLEKQHWSNLDSFTYRWTGPHPETVILRYTLIIRYTDQCPVAG